MIEEFLNTICLDERIEDGIFDIENTYHMDILQEYLIKSGVSKEDSIICRNSILEGKYPERQAYNVNGLLVTFPTPEYKQRAIARGTHFEENPKKDQANIFQAQPQQAASPAPATTPAPQPDVQPQPAAPAPKLEPAEPLVPAAEPAEKELSVDDTEKDERTPKEKAIDAKAVQNILASAPASIDIAAKYPNLESINYTLKEAKNNNFYEKNGNWYDVEGNYIGKKWYCESTKKIIISK